MNAIAQISICCTSKRDLPLTQARDTRAKFSPIPKRDPCLTYLTFKSPNLSLNYNSSPSHSQQPNPNTTTTSSSSQSRAKMESDVQEQTTTSPAEHLLNKYLPLPYRVATLIVLGMPNA